METVGDWMRHPVHTVKPHDSVSHARGLMERLRINQLPVVVKGALVGIVTDRDLRDVAPSVVQSLGPADAAELDAIPVESVMTSTVLTVTRIDPLARAAALMRRERIGALPVLHGDQLVGIITRADLLGALAGGREVVSEPRAL
jgi:acetoin utilization protein AcuB